MVKVSIVGLLWILLSTALLPGCGSHAPGTLQDTQTQGDDQSPSDTPSSTDLSSSGQDALPADLAQVADINPDAPQSKINLPKDEAPHTDPTEWWYYTGVLKTDTGATYGFELVFFQQKIAGYTGYMAHYAVTDLEKQSFHQAMKTATVPAQQPTSGFKMAIGKWLATGHDGKDQLKADMAGYAIDLSLIAVKPVVLQYGDGAMTINSTEPFYYYSYTRMSASGTLTVDGTPHAVTGEVWMDHQWGTMGTSAAWDWYSLRLDDNTEIMLFKVIGGTEFLGGTLIEADGSYRALAGKDFTITATGEWKSPHTGATYGSGWTVEIPSAKLSVQLTPLLADQEYTQSIFGSPKYWEGLCSVTGTRDGSPVNGHAYVELTGYGK